MAETAKFPKDQYLILNYLNNNQDKIQFDTLINELKIDQVFVAGAVQTLSSIGLAESSEELYHEIKPGKEAAIFIESELPEKSIIKTLNSEGKALHIDEISKMTGIEKKFIGKTIKVLMEKKWATKEGPMLSISDGGKAALDTQADDEKVFALLQKERELVQEDAEKQYDYFKAGFEILKKRAQYLAIKERKNKFAWISDKGKQVVKDGIQERIEVTQMTHELFKDSKWKEVEFKPYDVNADSVINYPGKIHPFQRILNETRKVYLEMGFTEIDSEHIESAFWDFDTLFQPQDHPARDMQDTFYMKHPGTATLPDEKFVDEIRQTHENGGKTGSTGWGYKWNIDIAKNMVLRTHTTAASIQQLYKNSTPPLKVFCIGRVFRRETIDFKHLPVFTQVDGIIVDEKASLANLIGLLREFYRKMGFDKIDVRPAFFPYTEPSLEIFVYLEEKKDWIEMGGAGIFRKEVTLPTGCDVPVLAWGLGLERLAMLKYNITDIRDIYIANIKWLKEVKTCR